MTRPISHDRLPLLEVADPGLLDALYADPKAALLLLTRLDACFAIVAPGQMEGLLERLRKLGHLPKVVEK